MLIFLVNIMLNLSTYFDIFTLLFDMEDMNQTQAIKKPLFLKLIQFYSSILLPTATCACLIYYFLFGWKIIQLLDFYHQIYNRKSMKILSLLLLIIFHYVFLSDYILYQLKSFKQKPVGEALQKSYSVYMVTIVDFLVWTIAVIYKYGTYFMLNELYKKLCLEKTKPKLFYLQQIVLLAEHNRKLNRLLSITILTFFLINGPSYLITVTLLMLDYYESYHYNYYIYMTILLICTIIPIHITEKILKTLDDIYDILLYQHWKIERNLFPIQCKMKLEKFSKQTIYEMNFYQKDFKLNLFDCLALDYKFLLKFAVFIITNVVIIIQTN